MLPETIFDVGDWSKFSGRNHINRKETKQYFEDNRLWRLSMVLVLQQHVQNLMSGLLTLLK